MDKIQRPIRHSKPDLKKKHFKVLEDSISLNSRVEYVSTATEIKLPCANLSPQGSSWKSMTGYILAGTKRQRTRFNNSKGIQC